MKKIGDLNLIKELGRGAFGEVFLTSKDNSTEVFATKKMSKEKVLAPEARKYFNNEIFILQHIEHPNIMKLYEIKQSQTSFYLVTEFCNGGSLASCLEKYKQKFGQPFPQEVVQYLMRQIVASLEYLHSKKIIHRDLKLDNILLKYDNEDDKNNLNILKCTCKLCDFGFARYLNTNQFAQSVLGSPIYMDPKILDKMASGNTDTTHDQSFGYDMKADIWSLGTLCYEMMVGTPPFTADNFNELTEKLKRGVYQIPANLQLSREAISFLNGMLQNDSTKRLDIHKLADHIFLTGNVNTFTPLNLTGGMTMNTKQNDVMHSVWGAFGNEMTGLTNIDANMFNAQNNRNKVGFNYGGGINGTPTDFLGGLNEQMGNFNRSKTKQDKMKDDSHLDVPYSSGPGYVAGSAKNMSFANELSNMMGPGMIMRPPTMGMMGNMNPSMGNMNMGNPSMGNMNMGNPSMGNMNMPNQSMGNMNMPNQSMGNMNMPNQSMGMPNPSMGSMGNPNNQMGFNNPYPNFSNGPMNQPNNNMGSNFNGNNMPMGRGFNRFDTMNYQSSNMGNMGNYPGNNNMGNYPGNNMGNNPNNNFGGY